MASIIERRAFLAAFVAALSGCRTTKPLAKATREARRARIVSVSPSMTETVFAIGAGRLMVGRTSFCDYPPEATLLPVVGGFLDANLEAILALEPTLVVGERRPGGRDLDAALRAHGIETFFPPMYGVAQIEQMILDLGDLLTRRDDADRVVSDMKQTLDRVARHVAPLTKPRTLLLFDVRPLVAAGPDAFPNELLSLAGATNVVTIGGEYPRLSPEGVLGLDPDVVIDGTAGAYSELPEELLRSVPGLARLRALREGNVRRLETKTALRPGPRIGDGVEEIARLVHPEAEPR